MNGAAGTPPPDLVPDAVPVVMDVAPLDTDRRAPLAVVVVRIGPVDLLYAVAGRRRGKWEIMPPAGPAGMPGVMLPPAVQDAATAAILAAIKASPEATAHLARRGRN